MQYLLLYKGLGTPNSDEVMRLLNSHDIRLIDGSDLPRKAIVEIDQGNRHILQSAEDLGWKPIPEKKIPNPRDSMRKKIRR